MKITIGIPCNRQIKPQTLISLLELVAREKYEFHFVLETDGLTVAANRNQIVVKTLRNQSDYLLFVDDDMKFPPYMLDKLLQHDKEVIGVNSRTRKLNSRFTAQKEEGIVMREKNPFVCSSVGTGIMLIKTSVFPKIEKPWFQIETDDNGENKLGEDVWFCKRVKEKGIKIWCDPSIEIKHIGDFEY